MWSAFMVCDRLVSSAGDGHALYIDGVILMALLLIACCDARAQDRGLVAGPAAARELAPLQACLNQAISDARPQSNEVAMTIAQTSCADAASAVRLKIAEVHKRFYDPPPPGYGDPEKALMARSRWRA